MKNLFSFTAVLWIVVILMGGIGCSDGSSDGSSDSPSDSPSTNLSNHPQAESSHFPAFEGENWNTPERFPDSAFRSVIARRLGLEPGSPFGEDALAGIEGELICSNRGIRSLQGIEYLPNITSLDCSGNRLETLDLSQNHRLVELICGFNLLTELDLSNLHQLERLICLNNPLTEIDVSMAPRLRELDCWSNQLTEIDVSRNPELEILGLDENQIQSIDLSNNLRLKKLYLSMNQLTELDVSANLELVRLDCDGNFLRELPDLSGHLRLETLDIRWNYFDCDDWPVVTALKERLGEIVRGTRSVEYGPSLQRGFAYSPQRDMDPYECP